jgi:NAD(P)-dependent dehydrogenase (short-subunit alcohol dehydrogenase family)
MAGKLEGKVAVITGAGSGQGAAMTKLFIDEGARVVLADLNETGMRDVSAGLDANSYRTASCDVSDDDQVSHVVATAVEEFGGIDVLCNVAGIGADFQPLPEVPLERVQRQFDVNFFGAWLFMRHAIPIMVDRGGGSIVNIGSLAGLFGNKGNNGAYGAAKAALMHLTLTVAGNYGGDNIRANAIAPGRIDTPLARGRMDFSRGDQERSPDDPRLQRPNLNPLGRVGQPSDIASAALFLACDDSSYVNGVILPVDGGWLAAGGGLAGG